MDILNVAKNLAREIQKSESYINLKIASQNNDNDEKLQDLIGKFNLKKIAISTQMSEDNENSDKTSRLNEELKACYKEIMNNSNMLNYMKCKKEFDELIRKINLLVVAGANGEDVDSVNMENNGCAGSCGSCGGCQ